VLSFKPLVHIIIVLALVLLQGCAFIRGNYGDELSQGDVTMIKKGTSTRTDVAAILGAPDRIIEANGHEIFHYYHYDVKSGFVLFFREPTSRAMTYSSSSTAWAS
jgi:outer membrane protein assembly factor BamE (lipoprotein component of BamABCDE complex)